MGIYRGPGGVGDAVNDASSEAAITVLARDEAVAARNAAVAAKVAAELAETNAEAAASATVIPVQAGNSGKYLKTNGTDTSWDALDISTADVSGTLPIANGGTGATLASSARTNLGLGTAATTASTDYATAAQGTKADTAHGWGNHASAGYATYPSQTGNSGKYLTTDGTNSSWDALATVANSGSYNDLSDKPTLTTNLDGLTDVAITSPATDQVLKYNGSGWVNGAAPAGGQYFGTAATKAIAYNAGTISENITVSENAMSVGPITISSGYTVTVNAGKRWVIL